MDRDTQQNREMVLKQWRTRILNGFLIVVVIASIPAFIVTILRSRGSPSFWSITISFSVIELIAMVVAIFRRINFNIRVTVLMLVGYAAAVFSLRLGGLLGAAPLYLMVLPIVGLILMGRRVGSRSRARRQSGRRFRPSRTDARPRGCRAGAARRRRPDRGCTPGRRAPTGIS